MMLACLFCAQLSSNCLAQSGINTTYVGPDSPINGALATSQSLDNPTPVAPAGVMTAVAGNGTSGYSGDRGQATSAQLSLLSGIAVDSTGNLYIAGGNRIRKVLLVSR